MRNVSDNCCAWRRKLVGGAVSVWGLSLIADAAAYMGWAVSDCRMIAIYAIVSGMALMVAAAFVCGFDLQFQSDSRAANAELLDGGVILAALLLFSLNVALRLHSPGSELPLFLSLVGFVGVLAELYLDGEESGATLDKDRGGTVKA